MSFKKMLNRLLFCLIPLVLFACGESEKQKITLTGSSTVAPLAMELGAAFEAKYNNVQVDVQTGGSSRGVADARANLSDIGMVSRALKDSEGDLKAHTIAFDGISLILNKKNPVAKLSNIEVIKIYKGSITNWQQVNGPDQPITVVNKAEGRSTLELFLSYFKLDNREIEADVVIGDNQQGIKTVAGNPWAIAYVSVGTAEFEEQSGTPIKLLGVGGVEASIAAIKEGNYPLSRPLNFVTLDTPKGLIKEFIDFAQSHIVNDIIEQQYFISVDAN